MSMDQPGQNWVQTLLGVGASQSLDSVGEGGASFVAHTIEGGLGPGEVGLGGSTSVGGCGWA